LLQTLISIYFVFFISRLDAGDPSLEIISSEATKRKILLLQLATDMQWDGKKGSREGWNHVTCNLQCADVVLSFFLR
jgi:hypothetical protein